jgi:hypothetical protein
MWKGRACMGRTRHPGDTSIPPSVPNLTAQIPFAPTRGVRGVDVYKIAGVSISGTLYSFKTGDPQFVRQAFTSHVEEWLAYYLEYHPQVLQYQRGDATPECSTSYGLPTPLGDTCPITYVWEGKVHTYLPDFVGTLTNGGLLIAEAGRYSAKRTGQELAKADAASQYAQLTGGEFWIATDEHIASQRHWHQNVVRLHTQRTSFETFEAIRDTVLDIWPWGTFQSMADLVARFRQFWSVEEVELCV